MVDIGAFAEEVLVIATDLFTKGHDLGRLLVIVGWVGFLY